MRLTYLQLDNFQIADLPAIRNHLLGTSLTGSTLLSSDGNGNDGKPTIEARVVEVDGKPVGGAPTDNTPNASAPKAGKSGKASNKPDASDIEKAEKAILQIISSCGDPITRKFVLEKTKMTEATWSAAIAALKSKKLVKQKGQKRATTYTAK